MLNKSKIYGSSHSRSVYFSVIFLLFFSITTFGQTNTPKNKTLYTFTNTDSSSAIVLLNPYTLTEIDRIEITSEIRDFNVTIDQKTLFVLTRNDLLTSIDLASKNIKGQIQLQFPFLRDVNQLNQIYVTSNMQIFLFDESLNQIKSYDLTPNNPNEPFLKHSKIDGFKLVSNQIYVTSSISTKSRLYSIRKLDLRTNAISTITTFSTPPNSLDLEISPDNYIYFPVRKFLSEPGEETTYIPGFNLATGKIDYLISADIYDPQSGIIFLPLTQKCIDINCDLLSVSYEGTLRVYNTSSRRFVFDLYSQRPNTIFQKTSVPGILVTFDPNLIYVNSGNSEIFLYDRDYNLLKSIQYANPQTASSDTGKMIFR